MKASNDVFCSYGTTRKNRDKIIYEMSFICFKYVSCNTNDVTSIYRPI
jgi:hypothetical protein